MYGLLTVADFTSILFAMLAEVTSPQKICHAAALQPWVPTPKAMEVQWVNALQ